MLREEAQALQHRAAELAIKMKKWISELKNLPLPERTFKAKSVAQAARMFNMLIRQHRRLTRAAGYLVMDAENAVLNDAQVRSQSCMFD